LVQAHDGMDLEMMFRKYFSTLFLALAIFFPGPTSLVGQSEDEDEEPPVHLIQRNNASSFYGAVGAGMSLILLQYLDFPGRLKQLDPYGSHETDPFSWPIFTTGGVLVLATFYMSLDNPTSLDGEVDDSVNELEEVRDEFLEFQMEGEPELSIEEMQNLYPSLHNYLEKLRAQESVLLTHSQLISLARSKLFGE